jgi:hypothetical protein
MFAILYATTDEMNVKRLQRGVWYVSHVSDQGLKHRTLGIKAGDGHLQRRLAYSLQT